MPGWKEPWPAFQLIRKVAIDDVSRHNLLAGLAAGMMIVNMKTPIILESITKERISRLAPGDAAAFAHGVACSMVMRLDTTPDEENALRFIRHTPAAGVAELWEKYAAGPARLAKDELHPKLKTQRRVDQITCYRPRRLPGVERERAEEILQADAGFRPGQIDQGDGRKRVPPVTEQNHPV